MSFVERNLLILLLANHNANVIGAAQGIIGLDAGVS